jgi:hypothetical protein
MLYTMHCSSVGCSLLLQCMPVTTLQAIRSSAVHLPLGTMQPRVQLQHACYAGCRFNWFKQ